MISRRFIALTILCLSLCAIGGAFFVLNTTQNLPSLMAAVARSDVPPEQKRDTTADVMFSDDVSTITSTKDRDDVSGGIEITQTEEGSPSPTELVVEKNYSGDVEVTHAVSYKYDTTTLINAIHERSNEVRESEQLPSLTFDATLAQLANERSEDMAKNSYFSHTAKDGCDLECRFTRGEYEAVSWGENLAEYEPYTRLSAPELAKELVSRWSKSSEHRRNLLSSDFTHHGVGVALRGNRIVVTVIFSRPK